MRPSFLAPVARLLARLTVPVLLSSISPAQVVKIVVHDTIQPITAEYISRAIDEAASTHAQAILIQMNTPGGMLSSTRDIVEKITTSPVPVIVYVGPTGARAGSAGIFILESADVAAMAPGTNAGAAHPVLLIGPITVKTDDEMKRKIENDSAAFIRSVSGKRGRNTDAAESAVRESKAFSEQEALAQNLIDYVASSEEDLFRQIQSKPVRRFNGQTVQVNLVGQAVQPLAMTVKQRVLDYLMDPDVAFVLLAIGLLALYVEFNHPGAVVPGTLGVIFILLAGFALNLLPVRFAALALIATSFVLFALEAKFVTHGFLTTCGIVLLTLGGLLLIDAPIPEMRVHFVTSLAVSIPLGLITAFLMTVAVRARRNKVVTGVQGLVAEIGVARTALSPQGKVLVHGEIWNAVSSSPVPAGGSVVVVGVSGLQLNVAPLVTPETAPAVTAGS